MNKVFVVGGDSLITSMFISAGWEIAKTHDDADLVQFTGGEDVSPSLYEEEKHPHTYSSRSRDNYEKVLFDLCIKKGKFMAGICRGGQFLNVMSGGRMYQHVDRHTRNHMITDVLTGESLYATSTHHQMMRHSSKAQVVATAMQGGFKEYMKDGQIAVAAEPLDMEVLYYTDTNSLCFQPHPEYCIKGDALPKYYFSLLNRFFNL